MEVTVILCGLGLILGLAMSGMVFAKGLKARDGRAFLALVFLEASLYFLAELIHPLPGLAARAITLALDYGSIFYGLPSLYFFARSAMGRSIEKPLLHYVPALVAIPLGTCLAFFSAGRRDGGGLVAGAYILLALCGESAQLALYGRALLLLTSPRRGIVEGEWPRRTVIAGLCGYGAFLLLSWLGFLASLLGEIEGRWAAPLPGLDLGSIVVAVLLAWTLGLCALWGGRGGGDGQVAQADQGQLCMRTTMAQEDRGRGGQAGAEGRGIEAGGAKYGGKPLAADEAGRIVARTRALLAASEDLGAADVEPRRLASRLGLPYYLLSRAVNEEEGQSLGELVNEFRVERAKELLRTRPGLSVLDVALESGFQAKSTFNEVFRKRVGSSPSEYRSDPRAGT